MSPGPELLDENVDAQPEEEEDETEEFEGMGKGDVAVEGDFAHLPAQLPAANQV